MTAATINVPTASGGTMEIEGQRIGSFMVHSRKRPVFLEGQEVEVWNVTHARSGMRVPWSFFWKEAATSFAVDVEKVADWARVQVDRPDGPATQGVWLVAPTPEEKLAIAACVKARGGMRLG